MPEDRHRVWIQTSEFGADERHRALCACGWNSQWTPSRADAKWEHTMHLGGWR